MILKYLSFLIGLIWSYSLIKTQSIFSKKAGLIFKLFISKVSWLTLIVAIYFGYKNFSIEYILSGIVFSVVLVHLGFKFLGKSASQQNKNMSNETASSIDTEIRKIIDTQYTRATKLIKNNLDKMHLMADALMKYETIDTEQIDQIMEGKVPDAPDSWSDDDTSSSGKSPDVQSKDSPSASPAS